jgi:hypothetical protein
LRMKKHFQILFIFLLVGASVNFFEARFLPSGVTMVLQFVFALAAILMSVPFSFPKWEGFILPLQLMFLSIAISIVVSYFTWSQPVIDGLKASVPLMLWIFVFYLLKIKIPIRTLENIVLIYGGIYLVLYIFQVANNDVVYFGWNTSFSTERGIKRIIFPGGGLFFLASFIALTRATEQKRNKLAWVSMAIPGIIIPVMQVTRQLIVASLFIYIIHLTRKLDLLKKTVVLLTFAALGVFFMNSDLSVAEGLKKAQKTTNVQGAEYIRVKAGTYFLTGFSPNLASKILGNGSPYREDSNIGKSLSVQSEKNDYYLSDLGIIAVYIMFGAIAVIAFAMIWVKSFAIAVPGEYLYVKYYLWFLLFTGLTSNNLYHYNYLIATVFALYIFQRIYVKEKYKSSTLELLKKLLHKKEIAI